MIKFTTINVDGVEVAREFKTIKELTQEYYSDNCDLPANDDKIVYAELDGIRLYYPQFFEDLIEELGIKEKKRIWKQDFMYVVSVTIKTIA